MGTDNATRMMLLGIVGGSILVLGAAIAVELLMNRGGGDGDHAEHQAAMTNAPTDHPSPAASGGPDLHFSTTSADLGLVGLGKDVGYSFSFENTGAKTLRIGDVNVRAVKGC